MGSMHVRDLIGQLATLCALAVPPPSSKLESQFQLQLQLLQLQSQSNQPASQSASPAQPGLGLRIGTSYSRTAACSGQVHCWQVPACRLLT